MKLTVIGCSDAFGSGARLQTSYHVTHARGEFLIDCGATALMGLERAGLDPSRIPAIFITHLHGDHFAGLVWWLIHANHLCGRIAPLTIFGPAGLEARFTTAAEALFPGSMAFKRKFALEFVEYKGETPFEWNDIRVVPFLVTHPSGAPPYALRFETDGKVVAFSGDTEWVESLVPLARGADLLIIECFAFDKPAPSHLNWRTIERNLERLDARRIMLTHMGPEVLMRLGEISHPRIVLAEDGLALEV